MNTTELKKSLHDLIDSIDNKNLLINFYDLIKKRTTTKEGQLWSRLSMQEQVIRQGFLSLQFLQFEAKAKHHQ